MQRTYIPATGTPSSSNGALTLRSNLYIMYGDTKHKLLSSMFNSSRIPNEHKYRLDMLVKRKAQFFFDLRSGCEVLSGFACAYRVAGSEQLQPDLRTALEHAYAHEGILGVDHSVVSGTQLFTSCRLFTDAINAERFSEREAQQAYYDIARSGRIKVALTGLQVV